MSRSSSPARFLLPAAVAGLLALFAIACGSSVNPNAPMSLSGVSNASLKGGGASSAGKVDVCHKADGGYHLINISGNALPAHLAHGDGQPLGAVQGSTTQFFAANCEVKTLQKHTLVLVSGAGGGPGSLDPAITYVKNSGGTGTAVILVKHPWYPSLAGASWVNWAMTTTGDGFGQAHVGDDITYTMGFTLPAGAMNVSLSGTFYADNRGGGFLNGLPIGAHPAGIDGGWYTPVPVGAASGFTSGANTLSFTVEDQGGIAGLTFAVTVTYFAL